MSSAEDMSAAYYGAGLLALLPAVFLQLVNRYAVAMAARIAALWQSPPRLVAILRGEQQDEPGLPSPLLRALLAGELLASLSLLAAEGKMTAAECAAQALAAGVPAPLFVMLWARLHPPAE